MKIKFKKQFLKDLIKIPVEYRNKIERLAFNDIPEENSEQILKRLSKMKGYEGYYKIKVGDYRMGLYMEKNILEFQRVLHRKDIYRFFPQ